MHVLHAPVLFGLLRPYQCCHHFVVRVHVAISEIDGGRSARARSRQQKKRAAAMPAGVAPPPLLVSKSAAQLALQLVGQNQSEMTAKLFVTGERAEGQDSDDDDGLEDARCVHAIRCAHASPPYDPLPMQSYAFWLCIL